MYVSAVKVMVPGKGLHMLCGATPIQRIFTTIARGYSFASPSAKRDKLSFPYVWICWKMSSTKNAANAHNSYFILFISFTSISKDV